MTEDLYHLSAQELGTLLRKREVSALEIVQVTLKRIESLEPRLNAYITVTTREALDAARRCDKELAAGQDRGPLHGIPMAVKDLYDTAGVRTTSGSKILADRIPDQDAASIRKLRAAGAVIVGKTNLNEFACGVTTTNAHYGDTFNPWDLARTPGGSSGGSAAAVAAGLCTVATGSDTGGSIRIPAALCGVVGFKPSYGRISCQGIMPLSWEQDHPGPITRTVYDAAITLQAMAGWDAMDPASVDWPVPDYAAELDAGIEGRKVGVDWEFALNGISTEVHAAFEAALEVLRDLGASVVDVHLPGLTEGMSAGLTMWQGDAAAVHEEWLRTRAEDYDPLVRSRLESARTVTGAAYAQAQRARRKLKRELQNVFGQVDLLATPMCAVAAPPHGASQVTVGGQEFDVLAGLTRYSRVFNFTGLPSISIPCGFTTEELPVGLQLIAPLFDEVGVLQAAQAYEQATQWHLRRPSAHSTETTLP
jgi:aspartyl-tRNA(Asn)/glutamyl-tRNA(Gln) amidotransferase subunit A